MFCWIYTILISRTRIGRNKNGTHFEKMHRRAIINRTSNMRNTRNVYVYFGNETHLHSRWFRCKAQKLAVLCVNSQIQFCSCDRLKKSQIANQKWNTFIEVGNYLQIVRKEKFYLLNADDGRITKPLSGKSMVKWKAFFMWWSTLLVHLFMNHKREWESTANLIRGVEYSNMISESPNFIQVVWHEDCKKLANDISLQC